MLKHLIFYDSFEKISRIACMNNVTFRTILILWLFLSGLVSLSDPTDLVSQAVPAVLEYTEAMKAFIKNDGWNEFHLIIRGHVLTHLLNGHVMSIVLDEDPKNYQASGLIGVQVHVGGPMKVEYRSFLLKPL